VLVAFYKRNLPHWHPESKCIFLTWRLYGSLPAGFARGLRLNQKPEPGETFRLAETLLDCATGGPLWLKNPAVADAVLETLLQGASEFRRYDLHAYSVMANHVHVLLTPLARVRNITRALKGITAQACNRILRRTGQRFWQDESFDHWVRNEGQFVRVKNYIEHNPVKAGLVAKAEDWPWSSASK
jgi:REP element-mobilizing transposase RayT